MEKIKVNMSPNPLDVQTIHASQNDGEARQWEFELHNNGELIDTSDVTDQMVFKAYKGGTEQLLPENTSTPTTSPFKGDIKYPQDLLTDQEFTYRQSPTESDGLAKITDIKGNTLKWNQLFKIYSPTTVTTNGVTLVTNADGTVTLNGTATARTAFVLTAVTTSNGLLASNHIYYMAVCPKGGSYNTYFGGIAGLVIDTGNGGIWKYNYTWDSSSLRIDIFEGVTFNNVSFKPQYIDLTLLFGAEKAEEILAMGQTNGVAYFRSLFPLSYYSYNQGSLLSFNGNGIKTTGRNILDLSSEFNRLGVNYTIDDDGWYTVSNVSNPNLYTSRLLLPKKLTNGSVRIVVNNAETTVQNFAVRLFNGTTVVAQTQDYFENEEFDRLGFNWSGSGSQASFKLMVVDSPTIGSYEPYTSSTLSLPISTYFPNGMDGVGDAYDELSNSRYAKRMGRIDLGSITYTRQESQISGVYFFVGAYNSIPNIKNRANSLVWNIKAPLYETVPSSNIYLGRAQNKTIGGYDAHTIRIRDDSFTDPTEFKNSLSGQYLVYELATPTETPITTASLVTENAEIPLSNEDGTLIGKCTEELSSEPGFIDAKIKLADGDGTCYSNKIQLHIERKP